MEGEGCRMRASIYFLTLTLSTCLLSCSKGEKSCDSDSGRAAIVEAVDTALNTSDCASAIDAVAPFYSKDGCGTNAIRLARAAAHACTAGINFFTIAKDLSTADLSGPTGFFNTVTDFFPSTTADSKVAAGNFALDSLFALQVPGAISTSAQTINEGTPHPGTLVPSMRTQDGNVYSMITSMALIGALHNRYGAPNASNVLTQKQGTVSGNGGWEVAVNMNSEGCTYAGTLLTFIDSINQVSSVLARNFGSDTASNLIAVAIALPLDTACSLGCNGISGSGCAISCSRCPDALRGRTACATSSSTDEVSCAAAGIVRTVNALYGL